MDHACEQSGTVSWGDAMTSKEFRVITLGCKVNQYESAFLRQALEDGGWCKGASGRQVDVAVINTCMVTQSAAHQSRQAIRKAIRENPGAMIVVVGCYAQVSPEELSAIRGVGLVAGNTAKGDLPSMLLNTERPNAKGTLVKAFEPGAAFEILPVRRFSDRSRAFLKVQDGCDSFCSYCIVPSARGHPRSLVPDNVISMLRRFSEEGYKEVVLTGIHLGKYGADLSEDISLKGLLRLIGKQGFSVRIRLSSIEPNEIDEELVGMMSCEGWLCRHFHIPLQSGDERVLKAMNRHYSPEDFARLINRIHEAIPFVALGVDVMAGFPGEDDRAHRNTLSLIDQLPVSYLHVFPFSRRPGTPAALLGKQNDPERIKDRASELRELGKQKRVTFYRSCLDKKFQVLFEKLDSEELQRFTGTSDNYLPVVVRSSRDLRGQMVPVSVERVEGYTVVGSVLQITQSSLF